MLKLLKEKFQEASAEDLVLGFMGISLGLCFLGAAVGIFSAAIRYAITGH